MNVWNRLTAHLDLIVNLLVMRVILLGNYLLGKGNSGDAQAAWSSPQKSVRPTSVRFAGGSA